MIILTASVPGLGSFNVLDDGSVEEVLFLPFVEEWEIQLLSETIQERVDHVGVTFDEAVRSALSTVYGFPSHHALIDTLKTVRLMSDTVLP